MKTSIVMGLVGIVAVVGACRSFTDEADVRVPDYGTIETTGKTHAEMLNLSHIECLADGTVNAHFVLLFHGSTPPATLSGTYLDDGVVTSFGPVTSTKSSGNVWHYNVTLTSGEIEILSASVGSTTLHNPGDYSGNYQCGPDNPQCPVQPLQRPACINPSDIGGNSPAAVCAYWGLGPTSGRDDGPFSSDTTSSLVDAYFAIVKGGRGNDGQCAEGTSKYTVYSNVSIGDPLSTGNGTTISDITYCECPVPAQ